MPRRSSNSSRVHPPESGRAPGLDELVDIAARVTAATGAPVVGGVAVALHGGGRHTSDIDIYSTDFWATHEKLEAAGILWDSARHEHRIDGIPVRMVSDEELGGPPGRVSTIRGVRVLGLSDLVRAKLVSGLAEVRRAKDIAHVLDLIRAVPLEKSFASKLPTRLRVPFKRLVDEVHAPRRTSLPARQHTRSRQARTHSTPAFWGALQGSHP